MKHNLTLINRLSRKFDMSMFYSISVMEHRLHLQGNLSHDNIVKIKAIDQRNRFKCDVTAIGSVEFTYKQYSIILL
jgi:hypothetical protein